MATSSITKDFYVKDYEAYERLRKDLDDNDLKREQVHKSNSLETGRRLLANFKFRDKQEE